MSGFYARNVQVYRPGVGMVWKRRERHYPHGRKHVGRWVRYLKKQQREGERVTGYGYRWPQKRYSKKVHRAYRNCARPSPRGVTR